MLQPERGRTPMTNGSDHHDGGNGKKKPRGEEDEGGRDEGEAQAEEPASEGCPRREE